MTKRKMTDSLVVGFALFSMFFGAGNVIFPPYLGMLSGPKWLLGFISYYIADIGLALLAIYALIKNNQKGEGVIEKLGNVPGKIMMSAIIICIGPLLAIPRTAATTYEMAVTPFINPSKTAAVLTSIIYFAIVLIFSINESKVVDIVGKFLTPALLIGLLIMIIKGVFFPIGTISATAKIDSVVTDGIIAGYQTMDVLAALAFGIIIIENVKNRGYDDLDDQYQVVSMSSIIAATGLLVVYGGLTYLGATASEIYNQDINRAHLVMNITEQLLGPIGVLLLGIVVTLACLTTAIALVSTSANHFSKLSNGKVSYKTIAVIVALFSTIISNFGLDRIISFASPILSFIYPGVLSLIILSFFSDKIKNINIYRAATVGAMLTSLLEILNGYGLPFDFIENFPLAEYGFAWILPSAGAALIGIFIQPKKRTARPKKQIEI